MLRFDVPPVWSNVVRWEAFISFLICLAAYFYSPWLMIILMAQGFIRGFISPHKCPGHIMWTHLFEAKNWGGAKENAGARMFANKLLFIAATVSVVAYALGASFWQVPVVVLAVFTTLEWAVSFCAACWVYGLWYRWFPPKSI